MPWGRLDDGLYDHPKVEGLGRQRLPAIGLWTLSISWSNRRLTDGFVPSDRIVALGGTPALAGALVDAGLFERADGGFRIHDFLAFNDSREQVLARREAAAERQRRHRSGDRDTTRESQRESRGGHSVTSGDVTPSSQRESRDSTRAHDRARPGPTESDSESRPRDSLQKEDRSSSVPPDRPDVELLKSLGWKRVTAKQRELLDEIADRHDRPSKGEAWGTYAATVMAETPEGSDPITHLRAMDDAWQVQRRAEIDAEDARYAQEKAQREADARGFAERMREAGANGTWFDRPAEVAK